MKRGFRALSLLMINFAKERCDLWGIFNRSVELRESNIPDSKKPRKIPHIKVMPLMFITGELLPMVGLAALLHGIHSTPPRSSTFFQKSLLKGRGVAEPLSLVPSRGLSVVTPWGGATTSGAFGFCLAGGSWEGGTFLSAFTQVTGGCSGLWEWKDMEMVESKSSTFRHHLVRVSTTSPHPAASLPFHPCFLGQRKKKTQQTQNTEKLKVLEAERASENSPLPALHR